MKLTNLKNSFKRLFNIAIPFEAQTLAEQRVSIAKDVIAQLKIENFIANKGNYIKLDRSIDIDENASLKDNFNELKNIGCQTCAMGACLLSIIHFKNDFNFGDLRILGYSLDNFVRNDRVINELSSIFDPYQLALIEAAFEGDYDGERIARHLEDKEIHILKYPDKTKVRKFYDEYHYSNDRLIAIMKNIIKNKGTFVLQN